MMLASLADSSDVAGIVGTVVALVGLVAVFVQLRGAAVASRAQATIQFQQAFHASRPARARLQETFPVHQNVLNALVATTDHEHFRSWRMLEDLTDDERAAAAAVVNALNDVGQHVTDGLSMRSALQQYHSIFVRAGALLGPFLDQHNAPRIDASGQAHHPTRYGRRVPKLFNAGLAYHRCHPKHTGKELALERKSVKDGSPARIVLVDIHGGGIDEHHGYPGDPQKPRVLGPKTWKTVVRRCERDLRR